MTSSIYTLHCGSSRSHRSKHMSVHNWGPRFARPDKWRATTCSTNAPISIARYRASGASSTSRHVLAGARRGTRSRAGRRTPSCRGARSARGSRSANARRRMNLVRRPRSLTSSGRAADVLDELAIEKRRACLERIGHRAAIGLHQQIVREVGREVRVQQPAERRIDPPSTDARRAGATGARSGRAGRRSRAAATRTDRRRTSSSSS